MTWVSELRFLVCTGKITALYEVVVRLPGGDVGFDKGKPVLGSSCCTREPWGAPDHTSRTPQKSLRICQESNFHKGQEFSPVLFTAVFPVPRTAPQRDEEKIWVTVYLHLPLAASWMNRPPEPGFQEPGSPVLMQPAKSTADEDKHLSLRGGPTLISTTTDSPIVILRRLSSVN
uniref:uncharacterized protein LOC118518013 isoform X5 n=1 Tax=Halichoerus grypus TaxID=9711 RepID=UPI00165973E9|nr:uncharacterized protein LOC118518013 isoform X5 [Halichoerus grypus]